MDKYEVTTKLFATFLQAAGRAKPTDWSQQVALVESGNRPVVNVTWHDAEAYCRSYGKRLPTVQEWEKAARGTDGREYPWGNETPTSRHANYRRTWDGYETLAPVGSYEDGKSPYGLYDMRGMSGSGPVQIPRTEGRSSGAGRGWTASSTWQPITGVLGLFCPGTPWSASAAPRTCRNNNDQR